MKKCALLIINRISGYVTANGLDCVGLASSLSCLKAAGAFVSM